MGTFDPWIGREERRTDIATAAPVSLMAATLDRKDLEFAEADPIPPVWHWLYFLTAVRTRELGPDGHPPKGGFLPPVPLPRRMRAGGQFRIERPIHIGEKLERRSRIADISEKSGGSGPLVFVKVEHEIRANGEVAVVEEESIVYREAAKPGAAPAKQAAPVPIPAERPGESRFPTNPMLLFRTSALTFNSHRIHYDTDYAVQEEAYPGRVVHGPLLALLMLEHLHKTRASDSLRQFQYRALAPTFCGEEVAIADEAQPDGRIKVTARNGAGAEAVAGEATYG